MKKQFIHLLFLLTLGNFSLQAQDFVSNIVPLSYDQELGLQSVKQIEADPKIKILDEKQYPDAYTYIRGMTTNILESGQVKYKKEFPWIVKIIHDDKTLNAFCTPGGYIYVYTGLIKYLDNEDHLAGVMGHEIAHADRRHSLMQMVKNQGLSAITQIVLGKNQNTITQLVSNLLALKFSRTDETEADRYSVNYLCATTYQADGAAGFFQKLEQQGQSGGTPEFMSTHPSPKNRVQAITKEAAGRQCKSATVRKDRSAYQRFKDSLPK